MDIIKVENFTKDYGFGRGVFNATINVKKGEVFGYLGPNGAGKTTTIRHIMGFAKADVGSIEVLGMDAWNNSSEILKKVGYLPGEIALFENMTGTEFLKYMAYLRKVDDFSYMNYLIDYFEFDPKGKIKKMALGNKRKLAIVTAFMHDPDILVLDEPTSGLDPVMQNKFIEFILLEKKRGKTILLSSHIFQEVDATCDRIAIIKEGFIVSIFDAKEIQIREEKTYKIEFCYKEDYNNFLKENEYKIIETKKDINQIKLFIKDVDVNDLFNKLSKVKLKYISEIKFTLEDYFLNFYDIHKTVEEGIKGVSNQD